jgi:hypothetical protein
MRETEFATSRILFEMLNGRVQAAGSTFGRDDADDDEQGRRAAAAA